MAKSLPGARLLRSLTRAGKSQQKLFAQLFAVPKPKPKAKAKAKPKAVAKAAAKVVAKPRPVAKTVAKPKAVAPDGMPIRQHSRPQTIMLPGRWLAAQHVASSTNAQLASQTMQYWLYLPENVPEMALKNGLPLIVMLHGCHQTATQFATGTRMNRLAEQKGYAVLYPQQSVSTNAHRCWRWYEKSTQQGGGDSGLIASLIGQVCDSYPIDRRRVYACGISAGAGMANIVALNHPELIAAVGLHSGPVYGGGHSTVSALRVMQHGAGPQAASAIREILLRRPAFPLMPTILIQGEGDTVVRPVNQAQLVQQSLLLNRLPAGTQVTVVERAATRGGSRNAHEIRDYYVGPKVLLRVARIVGLAHAWSGGDATLSYNAKAGPDASKMMMDFFSKHRRPLARAGAAR